LSFFQICLKLEIRKFIPGSTSLTNSRQTTIHTSLYISLVFLSILQLMLNIKQLTYGNLPNVVFTGDNETLTHLNLAWNQIRKSGISCIAKGIGVGNFIIDCFPVYNFVCLDFMSHQHSMSYSDFPGLLLGKKYQAPLCALFQTQTSRALFSHETIRRPLCGSVINHSANKSYMNFFYFLVLWDHWFQYLIMLMIEKC
jgi:hypothetical protein